MDAAGDLALAIDLPDRGPTSDRCRAVLLSRSSCNMGAIDRRFGDVDGLVGVTGLVGLQRSGTPDIGLSWPGSPVSVGGVNDRG